MPFHVGLFTGGPGRTRGRETRIVPPGPEPVTGSSGTVIAGLAVGENPGMKRFRGNVGGEMRHDAEETADARDTTA